MNHVINTAVPATSCFLPACIARSETLPWVPSTTPGKSSKSLGFLPGDSGFVELLRMEPGVAMPLHRHTGAAHAWNLSGKRQLCTGEVIGPGDYVFEPPGNEDWWKIVGDEPMIALVVVLGEVEFLGPGGEVRARASAASQRTAYEAYCREQQRALQVFPGSPIDALHSATETGVDSQNGLT